MATNKKPEESEEISQEDLEVVAELFDALAQEIHYRREEIACLELFGYKPKYIN